MPKMSDSFTLPVTVYEVETTACSAGCTYSQNNQDAAAQHAINHHDALVDALADVLDRWATPLAHGDARNHAQKLLDEVNKP